MQIKTKLKREIRKQLRKQMEKFKTKANNLPAKTRQSNITCQKCR